MEYNLYIYDSQGGNALFHCSTNSSSTITANMGSGLLVALTFCKEIYKPCKIDVSLMITDSNVPVSEYQDALIGKICQLDADSTTLAYNYYVHAVRPKVVYENGEKQNMLFLTIYSMDKLLDIVEECHSYVGQHLCSGILKDAVERYTSGTDYKIEINADTKNLQFLGYEGKDKKGYELIQPYIVQYNETFYSMLARTANRCGEYMFFEDGKLNVGLASPSTISMGADTELSVRYPRVSVESIFNDIKYHTRSYSKTDGNTDAPQDKGDITSAPESVGATGFEYNTDKKPSASFIKDYSIPVDEYHVSYEKDSYGSNKWKKSHYLKLLYKFIDSPISIVASAALVGIEAGITDAVLDQSKTTADNIMNNAMGEMKPYGDETEYVDGNKHNLYSSFDIQDATILKNIVTDGFIILRRCEEQLADLRLVIEVDTAKNTTNFLLGRSFTYDNTDYIVSRVERRFENSRFTEIVEAVPVITIKNTKLYIPPMIPAGHVRYAEPQTAKVVSSQDPKKMGRVRVRYSWQEAEKTDKFKDPTPFIRVATPFAAKDAGMYFQLAKNEEVMVKFDHGNVERPYVSCSLYNSTVQAPLGADLLSPASRIIRSQNGHKIVLSDLNDSAFGTFFTSNPILSTAIAEVKDPKGDGTESAGGICLSDKAGFYKIEASSDKRKISLSCPFGSISLSSFTGISVDAPFGDINIYGKNIAIKARNKIRFNSGIALANNFLNIANTAMLEDFVASTFKDYICDLNIVRHVLERVFEPLQGDIVYKPATTLSVAQGDEAKEIIADDDPKKTLLMSCLSWIVVDDENATWMTSNFRSRYASAWGKRWWSIAGDDKKFKFNNTNNTFEPEGNNVVQQVN